MSDLREQLLKAGLVSSKQVRQAKHEDRIHRKEVGHKGLEAEQAKREDSARRREEEKRQRDQEYEKTRRQKEAEEERARAFLGRIRAGWLRDATGGNRRFYFVVEGGRITYLDLTDPAVRRLQSGSAAIVASHGVVRGDYCLVDAAAAAALARDDAGTLIYWNRSPAR